jgi:hypothetical protein
VLGFAAARDLEVAIATTAIDDEKIEAEQLDTKRDQGATARSADRILVGHLRPISGMDRCTLAIPLSLPADP